VRRFFDNWFSSLKWQRLGPYERFADMSIATGTASSAYCKPENKVSFGFVEGSVSSSGAPTNCATGNISASRPSLACCRRYGPAKSSKVTHSIC
jgi:hypothetical protein